MNTLYFHNIQKAFLGVRGDMGTVSLEFELLSGEMVEVVLFCDADKIVDPSKVGDLVLNKRPTGGE
jgi:hypothetical protein